MCFFCNRKWSKLIIFNIRAVYNISVKKFIYKYGQKRTRKTTSYFSHNKEIKFTYMNNISPFTQLNTFSKKVLSKKSTHCLFFMLMLKEIM